MTTITRKRPIVAPELNTVLNITAYVSTVYEVPFWADQRALDATRQSPPTSEYCKAQVAQLRRHQDIMRIHIDLLQEHILDKRVKYQLVSAKQQIKVLQKGIHSLGLDCQPWYNGGYW
jgi:hypothetical protein